MKFKDRGNTGKHYTLIKVNMPGKVYGVMGTKKSIANKNSSSNISNASSIIRPRLFSNKFKFSRKKVK